MMDPVRAVVIFYAVFWVIRLNGCVRRGRQPRLRGADWFFNVHVQPGFYDGPGRQLLRWYWMRMMIPFAVDIPIAIWIFASGRLALLGWLIIGLCALIHANHLISVDLAERQARPFAAPDAEPPVASITLSLTPRRLRDYSNVKFELVLIVTTVCALVFAHDHRAGWKAAAFLIYMHLGFVYAKSAIVAWRTDHTEAHEARRRYYLASCDWYRALLTAQLVAWSLHPGPLTKVDFAVWLAITVVSTVIVEIKRKQLARLSARAKPVTLPDLLRQSELARWPVCYQPSAPLLMLKGARGYSINLANTFALVGIAYVTGFVVLGRVL
jgi:hypothetical protein